MAEILRVLRGSNRNTSTADYQVNEIFTYGNRFYSSTLKHIDAAPLTLETGILVKRHIADPTKVEPIIAATAAELGKVIGIVSYTGELVLNQNDEANINYAHNGEIDGGLLVLPGAATLDTLVTVAGDITLKDKLTSLGFIVNTVTEQKDFDN